MNLGKETETIEFKKTTGELKSGMISIASILNKHGVGTLFFGVKPNGDVVGQDVSESTLRDISRCVYETIKPQVYPVIEEVILDEKHVIRVEFSGEDKPYSASGRYYLRTADEDREVSPTELKKFFIANSYKEKWEKGKTNISSKKIDKTAIKKFYSKAISVGRMPSGKYNVPLILKRFGLLNGDYLTNAGNILFGSEHPVTLKLAIFATDSKITFLDMKMYENNIYNLLGIAEDYILNNIKWRSEIIGIERQEIPEIPIAVIREVLANAFAHASYIEKTYHEISIHPNKITIYSPGVYASNFKPEDYVKRNLPSVIRNTTISKILYLNKSIEQFGSGFKRINSLCKDAKIKYSYEASETGFTFVLYRKQILNDKRNVTANVTVNVPLNETEQTVYNLLILNHNYTRTELADATYKSIRTIQRVLDSLKSKGLIKRVGSDKSGCWKINNNIKKMR